MVNVVVAFSKPEDAKSIKNILMRNGFQVTAVCSSGAQALARAGDLGSGILVCGYRLTDMLFDELSECLPPEFQMLLVASPAKQFAKHCEVKCKIKAAGGIRTKCGVSFHTAEGA